MIDRIKEALRCVAPHGLVEQRRNKYRKQLEEERQRFHEERRDRINRAAVERGETRVAGVPDYNAMISFLKSRGLPEEHLRDGTIPPGSLAFIIAEVSDLLPPAPAEGYLGLHVGNFVGISLATVTGILASLHPSSVTVSIDPNLTHRGIDHPQDHVLALLSQFHLQSHSLVIGGYSTSKSISNDGVTFADYDPATAFATEVACENCLASLGRFSAGKFHLVLVDGNHEGDYVARELKALAPLLAKGAILIMDDINAAWDEIASIFASLENYGFETGPSDGRVGLAIYKGLKV